MTSTNYNSCSDYKQNPHGNYPIYATPVKENICSLNLNVNISHNEETYLIDSTGNNIKQVLFKIQNSKYESSNESSLTHYLKSDISGFDGESKPPLKKGQSLTKKNLFSIFENTLCSPKTPNKKKRLSKYLFECSASSTTFATSEKKKKRCRKNKRQVEQLNMFYYEKGSKWNRSDIKEISNVVGIKETKVYKWLWDKRNKEEKKMKFLVLKNEI